MQTAGGCGMDFKRLAKITRKIVKSGKRIPPLSTSPSSTSICGQMPIFVRLPSRSIITLMVQPLDKIAAVKEQIEKKTQYLVRRQSLFLATGNQLDDRETLVAYNIIKDSKLHLTLEPDKRVDDSETRAAYSHSKVSSTSSPSTCGQMSIFVKLPSSNRSTITLMVQPLDTIAAIKEQIENRTRHLVACQSLFSVSGKWLDDRRTLAAYNISKDSTLHLKLNSAEYKNREGFFINNTILAGNNNRKEWVIDSETLAANNNSNDSTLRVEIKDEPPCDIEILVLPINRFISLWIPQGLAATIRDLKDFIFQQEGIVCEDFYLDDEITGEQLGDNVTLAACRVPERALVLVQSEVDNALRGRGNALYGCSEGKRRVSRGLVDVAFKEAFNTNRTVPGLEDMEPVEVRREVRRDPPEQNNQHGQVSDIETAIATILQTHQDCERKLTLMLDEKNKLQMDLLELQTKYPKLLSDVLEERNRLQQNLKELQDEFPRQLSCVLDEKNNLQQQLTEAQSEFHRQVTLVLDENSLLESQLDTLKTELGHEKEKGLCNICFDKPRDTLVFSCLHLHFCSSCLQKHQERTNTCPTCRGFISGKLVCNLSIS